MLGKVIIDEKSVLPVIPEILSHSNTAVRSEVLKRRRVAGWRSHDYRIVHRPIILKHFYNVSDRGIFLTNSYINTDDILTFLIDDSIYGNGCLSCLTISYDELSLASSYRNHGIDGFYTSLQRLLHWQAVNNTRRQTFDYHVDIGSGLDHRFL
ncbi:hypothetical protein ES703_63136 [subsurface metagenome]